MNRNDKIKNILTAILLLCTACVSQKATANPAGEFSTAGFYKVSDAGRQVLNFNVGWRFLKADAPGAEKVDFDDSGWAVVNIPHGLELLPEEASGSVNYQGPAWYRKHFKISSAYRGKKICLHFEAVMGKSKIWVNGKLLAEHFGGFLPIVVDISDVANFDGPNVVAVYADNSDDPLYPPGKPQKHLDFSYFGGIYRDVWFIVKDKVHITNANTVDVVAGGGVFVHYEDFSEDKVTAVVDTHIANETTATGSYTLETVLKRMDGTTVTAAASDIKLTGGEAQTSRQKLTVTNPALWHPDSPTLHELYSYVKNADGKIIDGQKIRLGIRKIEFRGADGFYLNSKPFGDKLIGGNRHQDFAYVGNALPNQTHWRDVKKLRDAGLRIIRSAHYPQDPAFMNACDELGMFIIVATPGWQHWRKEPIFAQRIYSDIRNMVRRDRNHPSVIMWEPILNETSYPVSFAKTAYETVHEEYPYQGCFAACDSHHAGNEFFDVLYSHPFTSQFYQKVIENTPENEEKLRIKYDEKHQQCIFTREWGDCVDDWSSHNSPSRVAAAWGEAAQLVQVKHYAKPDYVYTCWDALYKTPTQHVGGTLWHPFDHQRGYHPDPFWGGIMDAFRQPKYSYYMFQSQRNPAIQLPLADSGPMIYIAHEMTPFSGDDVWVFSNCDQVRLSVFGEVIGTKSAKNETLGIPHPPVVFKDIFRFIKVKALHRGRKWQQANILAEGLIDGKVVVSSKRMPAKRRTKILLKADLQGRSLIADGSDFVPIVAYMADNEGNIKRLSEDEIRFRVEGPGQIIGDEITGANPRKLEWGRAVALVRAGVKPGKIKVIAEELFGGVNMPASAELEIESVLPEHDLLYSELPQAAADQTSATQTGEKQTADQLQRQLEKALKELNELKLKEVERQQELFEGTKK